WPSSRSRGTCADDHRGPPHVARLPGYALQRDRRRRLLRSPDPDLPPALRVRGPSASTPRLLHVNVTGHPTAAWAAQQLVETFPDETAPKYLLRDRDPIYSDVFARRLTGVGIHEVLIAPRAPWQNPFAERFIGSIRRECLDHVIVFSERHLRRL